MVRLSNDPESRAYAERRRADEKSRREIIRCLRRYIARDVFVCSPTPNQSPTPANPLITRYQERLLNLQPAT